MIPPATSDNVPQTLPSSKLYLTKDSLGSCCFVAYLLKSCVSDEKYEILFCEGTRRVIDDDGGGVNILFKGDALYVDGVHFI